MFVLGNGSQSTGWVSMCYVIQFPYYGTWELHSIMVCNTLAYRLICTRTHQSDSTVPPSESELFCTGCAFAAAMASIGHWTYVPGGSLLFWLSLLPHSAVHSSHEHMVDTVH
jgi:hypothetical protein